MYKNYSYSNMPVKRQNTEPKRSDAKAADTTVEDTKVPEVIKNVDTKPCDKDNGLLGNLETDDLVLLIVAFVLLMDGCDDKLLLAAIAFVFMSDMN